LLSPVRIFAVAIAGGCSPCDENGKIRSSPRGCPAGGSLTTRINDNGVPTGTAIDSASLSFAPTSVTDSLRTGFCGVVATVGVADAAEAEGAGDTPPTCGVCEAPVVAVRRTAAHAEVN